jgi:hypothetical protein
MTSIAPIYLPYYVLIDCCMPTCTCTHAKLSKMLFFLGQILNLKRHSFWDGGSTYESDEGYKYVDGSDARILLSFMYICSIEISRNRQNRWSKNLC